MLKLEHPQLNKLNNLVQSWGKVLVTSRCTDYATNLSKPGQESGPKITFNIFAVTSIAP